MPYDIYDDSNLIDLISARADALKIIETLDEYNGFLYEEGHPVTKIYDDIKSYDPLDAWSYDIDEIVDPGDVGDDFDQLKNQFSELDFLFQEIGVDPKAVLELDFDDD